MSSLDKSLYSGFVLNDLNNDFACFHGGAFFEGIGVEFDNLKAKDNIISADVLDAWFSPAPKIDEIINKDLEWIIRTSPPTHAEGLIKTISEIRKVSQDSVLPGSGSSDLIFRIFPYWLNSSSKVLILDPTYGEYTHILKNVIGCKIETFRLFREEGYKVNISKLARKLKNKFDLFVWVNPNSPTGLYVDKEDIKRLLADNQSCKRIWIDETYIEYLGKDKSLERFAEKSSNIYVCKSMSKVYALSGVRAAYLCASPFNIKELRVITPPWPISLPAQISALYALKQESYYFNRYNETNELRKQLVLNLEGLGINEIVPGVANFLMFHVPREFKSVSLIIKECRKHGLYLRDISTMGSCIDNAIRMAVKDSNTNKLMIQILQKVLNS